jgi:DNA-binding FadR family transcriptional regulator
VTTQRGIGTFATVRTARSVEFPVRRVDQATLAEVLALLELRISLETEASALAAQRRSAEQVARMEALLETIGRSRSAAATRRTPTSTSTCASPRRPATTSSST